MTDLQKFAFWLVHCEDFQNALTQTLGNMSGVEDFENFAKHFNAKNTIDKDGTLTGKQLIVYGVSFDQPILLKDATIKEREGLRCKFGKEFIGKIPQEAGVYAWVFNNELVYIGEAKDLQSRVRNYSSPGNRATAKKINKAITDALSKGKKVEFYYYQTNKHLDVENVLLAQWKPRLNGKQ